MTDTVAVDPNDVQPAVANLETIVSLSKRRGFIFPSSEIYGGINAVWDYGPLGVELKNNVKRAWWKAMVQDRNDIVGPGRRDPHASPGVGHLRARRLVQRPARRVPRVPPPLPPRRAAGHRGADPDRPARRDGHEAPQPAVPQRRDAAHAAPPVQPDVHEPHGPGRGRRQHRLLPPRDRPGLVRQLQERPAELAQEDPVRHRADREVVPQRDLARQLRVPDARVRADGDAVLRAARTPAPRRRSSSGSRGARRGTRRTASPRPGSGSASTRPDELAHYAKKAIDVEYRFPFGWKELEGIHNRGDFDLGSHAKASGENLEYFDQAADEHFIPWVVETAAGADRAAFTFLIDAYREEEVRGETRVVLGLHPDIAPYKVAVLPLLKKRPEIVELCHKLLGDLKRDMMAVYDDTAAIGKLYRRQDEIGTPWCVTVDVDSLEDGAVTIRDRDSMTQERVPLEGVKRLILDRMSAVRP